MKYRMSPTALLLLLLSGLAVTFTAHARFWEIPDPDLKYIAMIRADPNWGSAVIYNPVYCEEVGVACGFFRDQAYAHAHMNHVLLPPSAYARADEMRADCWAAKNGKPEEVLAAARLMREYDGTSDWKIYGDPAQRSEHIRLCAQEAGNWIGS
ncbi:MAG: hypothetical protein MI673_00550 [Thiotrichales bacterium]|nr:hypothetical protein [Thiotrichales bacterium]